MLTHPDPQIQILLNDLAEQRDVAMVQKSNLQVALGQAQAEIATLKAAAAPGPAPDVQDAEVVTESAQA